MMAGTRAKSMKYDTIFGSLKDQMEAVVIFARFLAPGEG